MIHNTAMYELFLLLPLVALLWYLQRRRVQPGWLTVTFLLWYGTQRFFTDFLRAYDETVAGLTGAQYLSIGMVIGGLILAARLATAGPLRLHEPVTVGLMIRGNRWCGPRRR